MDAIEEAQQCLNKYLIEIEKISITSYSNHVITGRRRKCCCDRVSYWPHIIDNPQVSHNRHRVRPKEKVAVVKRIAQQSLILVCSKTSDL